MLVVELASGSRRPVLAADTVYIDCPQWSPKGTELLLTVYPSRVYPWKSSVTDARADLALFDFRSGRLRFVTTDHRSEEHTSELQSPYDLVCRLLLEKKKITQAFGKNHDSWTQVRERLAL